MYTVTCPHSQHMPLCKAAEWNFSIRGAFTEDTSQTMKELGVPLDWDLRDYQPYSGLYAARALPLRLLASIGLRAETLA